MNVGDHGTNVSCAIRTFAIGRILDRVQVVDNGSVEIYGVPFVERVNLASGGNFDLWNVSRVHTRRLQQNMLTSGWVRMNSPSAVSSVYPWTPEPVESTRLADDPYL